MGSKPSKGTPRDMRLKDNNPNAGKKPAAGKPPTKPMPPQKGGKY